MLDTTDLKLYVLNSLVFAVTMTEIEMGLKIVY